MATAVAAGAGGASAGINYGAVELKAVYNKYRWLGLGIAIAIHGAIIGSYYRDRDAPGQRAADGDGETPEVQRSRAAAVDDEHQHAPPDRAECPDGQADRRCACAGSRCGGERRADAGHADRK